MRLSSFSTSPHFSVLFPLTVNLTAIAYSKHREAQENVAGRGAYEEVPPVAAVLVQPAHGAEGRCQVDLVTRYCESLFLRRGPSLTIFCRGFGVEELPDQRISLCIAPSRTGDTSHRSIVRDRIISQRPLLAMGGPSPFPQSVNGGAAKARRSRAVWAAPSRLPAVGIILCSSAALLLFLFTQIFSCA